MKKIGDIIAFLFLSSLVIFSGANIISVHAQFTSVDSSADGTSAICTDPTTGAVIACPTNTNSGGSTNTNQTTNTNSSTGSTNTNRNSNSSTPNNSNSTTNTNSSAPLSNTNTTNSSDTASEDSSSPGNTNTNTNTNNTPIDSSTDEGDTTNANQEPGSTPDTTQTTETESNTEGPDASQETDPDATTSDEVIADTNSSNESINSLDTPPGESTEATEVVLPELPVVSLERKKQMVAELDREIEQFYEQRCVSLGVTNSDECQRLIAKDLDPECVKENISTPTACESFLKRKHFTDVCTAAGIVEEAECEAAIIRGSLDSISCTEKTIDGRQLSDEECRERAVAQFIGHIAAGIERRDAITKTIQSLGTKISTIKQVRDSLQANNIDPDILPLKESDTPVLLRDSPGKVDASSAVKAVVTMPYVIAVDADSDGLSDDLETIYGTDNKNPDTDGDGYSDSDELFYGYSPLEVGGEKRTKPLSPVETVLVSNRQIEQPVASGVIDGRLAVNSAVQNDESYTLLGTADPNSIVLLFVYSNMPLLLTVQTDEAGNWQYELKEQLAEGQHTIYTAVTDESGAITRKSNPLSFLVQEAQAATPTNFLDDEPIKATESVKQDFTRYYLFGGFSLIAIVLLGLLFIIIAKRKNDSV